MRACSPAQVCACHPKPINTSFDQHATSHVQADLAHGGARDYASKGFTSAFRTADQEHHPQALDGCSQILTSQTLNHKICTISQNPPPPQKPKRAENIENQLLRHCVPPAPGEAGSQHTMAIA